MTKEVGLGDMGLVTDARKGGDSKMFVLVNVKNCELVGPYECDICQGHLMLDATYLDQVKPDNIACPYCGTKQGYQG